MSVKYKLENGFSVPKCGVRAAVVVFGGFLAHLALGSFYSISNFSPYFISYLRNRTDDNSVRNMDILWITGAGSFSNCLGMSIGGILDNKFGTRITMLIGSMLYSGGVAVSFFSVKSGLAALIVTYGVVSECGILMTYGPPLQTVLKWFPTRPTLAVGVIVAGFGGGALIFNQVITQFINPDNLSPDFTAENGEKYFTDPVLLDRVPYCFVILGASYFSMLIIGICCVSSPPVPLLEDSVYEANIATVTEVIDQKEKTRGGTDHNTETVVPNVAENNGTAVSVANEKGNFDAKTDTIWVVPITNAKPDMENSAARQDGDMVEDSTVTELGHMEAIKLAFKTRSFYIIWISALFGILAYNFIGTLYKSYGQTFIADDHFLALVGSIASICSCISRPCYGVLMDRFGYRVTSLCIFGSFAALAGTLQFTEHMPKGMFMVWVCAVHLSFMGVWSVFPSTLAKLFGVRNMAVSYGFVMIAPAIGTVSAGVIATLLKADIGWHGLFYVAAGCLAVPFFLSFLFNGVDTHGKRI